MTREEKRLYDAQYRKAHREEHRLRCREYHKAHREEHRLRCREYHKAHREEHRLWAQKYYKKNRPKIRLYSHKYYRTHGNQYAMYRVTHREEKSRYNRLYNTKNKERLIEYRKKYWRRRSKIDINYKLCHHLRVRLRLAIKRHLGNKSTSAVYDLGCSVPELIQRLESKFQPGMSWDNWGSGQNKWHIDHVKPLASFDLTDKKQIRKAIHYTNLQPLWQRENLKKGSSDVGVIGGLNGRAIV